VDAIARLRRLGERNALDEEALREEARHYSPSERLAQALELSDVARSLARSVGAAWMMRPPTDLEDKANRYPTRR
jgi:hypothetical protein